MTISYPLNMPAVASENQPAQVDYQPVDQVAVGKNPYNFKTTVFVWPGDMWRISVALPVLSRAEAAEWEGFLYALRGKQGTFLWADKAQKAPLGIASGTPKVNGAVADGAGVIPTKGWTAGVTGILKKGDLLQIDNSLYKVVYADVNSSGAGLASIDVWPTCRGHADNAAITVLNPKCLMRLCDPAWTISIGPNRGFLISFAAEEAL